MIRDFRVYGTSNNPVSLNPASDNKWQEWKSFGKKAPMTIYLEKKNGKWKDTGVSNIHRVITEAGQFAPKCEDIVDINRLDTQNKSSTPN